MSSCFAGFTTCPYLFSPRSHTHTPFPHRLDRGVLFPLGCTEWQGCYLLGWPFPFFLISVLDASPYGSVQITLTLVRFVNTSSPASPGMGSLCTQPRGWWSESAVLDVVTGRKLVDPSMLAFRDPSFKLSELLSAGGASTALSSCFPAAEQCKLYSILNPLRLFPDAFPNSR